VNKSLICRRLRTFCAYVYQVVLEARARTTWRRNAMQPETHEVANITLSRSGTARYARQRLSLGWSLTMQLPGVRTVPVSEKQP